MTKLSVLFGLALALALGEPAAAQTLRTAVDATFAPHAMTKLGGGLQGYNIDIGNEVARRMGRKIDIEGTEFSSIVPGLNAKKYDFILTPVAATPERAKVMLFSEGYLDTDYSFLEKKSSPDVKVLEDLKGKTIAVNKGSAYEAWCRANADKYGFKFDVYGTNVDGIQAVLSGRADAILIGDGAAVWGAKQNPLLKASYTIHTGQVWALAFRLDDKAGRDTIGMVLKCMKQDGFLAKTAEKWFGIKPGPTNSAVAVAPGQGVPGMEGYDPTPVTPKCS